MDKLGIEPIQFLTQALNFVIMMVILTKFLYKPITKALDARRQKIEEGLKNSEKINLELEKTEKKRGEILAKAKEEARHFIDEAKVTGKKQEEEIIRLAREEALQISLKAKEQLSRQREQMSSDLKAEAIELASMMTQRVLSDMLTVKNQKDIIERNLKSISKQSYIK